MNDQHESTFEDTSPIFKSWNVWYAIVIICNIITITAIYLYFNSI